MPREQFQVKERNLAPTMPSKAVEAVEVPNQPVRYRAALFELETACFTQWSLLDEF